MARVEHAQTEQRVHRLARKYAKVWNTKPQLVLNGSQRHEDVRARWDMWRHLHEKYGLSLSAIGRWTGFDHSTVLNGIRRIKAEEAARNG